MSPHNQKPAKHLDNLSRFRKAITALAVFGLIATILIVVVSSPDFKEALLEFFPSSDEGDKITIMKDIPYVEGSGSGFVGDLYMTDSTQQQQPAVIVVHGGGWQKGSKNDPFEKGVSRFLAQHGYLAFNIDYPLVGKGGGFPRDIQAVKDAVLFIDSNADNWNIDRDNIFLLGLSSGAHLALMSAYTRSNKLFPPLHYPECEIPIVAVASFSAPSNLPELDNSIIDDYIQNHFSMNGGNTRQLASPLMYTSSAVPTIFLHGTQDRNVPFEQSVAMTNKLQETGIATKIVQIEGGSHWIGPTTRTETMKQVLDFFNKIVQENRAE